MNSNPWLSVPASDYEAHMSHDSVKQLQLLNDLTKKRLEMYKPESVVFLGACTGNGFEHIPPETDVYAVDINKTFLDICKKRYGNTLRHLHLIQANINEEELNFPKVDLVIADLIFEYLDMQKAFLRGCNLMNKSGILSIIIQRNNNNTFVSNTGIESLSPLSEISNEVGEDDIKRLVNQYNLIIHLQETYTLPNGKEFIRIDCGND